MPHSYFDLPGPRVLAHRGLARGVPENTLAAFERALAAGASYLETDVHVSADGEAVISHDHDLSRLAGRSETVASLTAKELGALDLGAGHGLPTLRAALAAFPQARFNIDVKVAGATRPTVRAVLEAEAVGRVLITSFDERRRRATVAGLPGVATSASAVAVLRAVAATRVRSLAAFRAAVQGLHALQVPERYGRVRVVTPRLIELAHRAGIEVHVWTVDDEGDMHRLLDLGVDGIVTDRADLGLPLVAGRRTG